jgi:hypothetical protein
MTFKLSLTGTQSRVFLTVAIFSLTPGVPAQAQETASRSSERFRSPRSVDFSPEKYCYRGVLGSVSLAKPSGARKVPLRRQSMGRSKAGRIAKIAAGATMIGAGTYLTRTGRGWVRFGSPFELRTPDCVKNRPQYPPEFGNDESGLRCYFNERYWPGVGLTIAGPILILWGLS